MGLFGPNKKKITETEFKELRTKLYNKLDMYELADVEQTFVGHLHEPGYEKGIDAQEFEEGIAWLKNNKKKHKLEDDDIALLETYAREHLKD